jgi:hypothetical protein
MREKSSSYLKDFICFQSVHRQFFIVWSGLLTWDLASFFLLLLTVTTHWHHHHHYLHSALCCVTTGEKDCQVTGQYLPADKGGEGENEGGGEGGRV